MEQHLKNHRRFYPLFHFFLIPLLFLFIVWSLFELYKAYSYTNVALAALFVLLLVTALVARIFALKAQDRAIRAEAALRYFILSGKPLPAALKLSQIVALRFAGDEECVALTERAAAENLKSMDIKQAIKSWKGDFHRV